MSAPIAAHRVFWAIKKNGRPSHQCGGKWRRRVITGPEAVTSTSGATVLQPPISHTCPACGSYFRVS